MIFKTVVFLLLLIVLLCKVCCCSFVCDKNTRLKCKTEDGDDVDWFLAYKLPRVKNNQNPLVNSGLAYAYILPNNQQGWTLSSKSINDSDSMVGQTLQHLYNQNCSLAFISYNDQPPNKLPKFNNGHSKGVLLTSKTGGFWLQHSVPHFPPPVTSPYSYPHTGTHNGQMFSCMSFPYVDPVADILTIVKPHVYNASIPSEYEHVVPRLKKFLDDTTHKKKRVGFFRRVFLNWWMRRIFSSKEENHGVFELHNGDRMLRVFAKGPSFMEEIYSDWIAPMLGSELNVQSWLNGPHAYHSNCTRNGLNDTTVFSVYNVKKTSISGIEFSTHSDHSKWAVTRDKGIGWVCVADLNRMEHQKVRGGAIVCFNGDKLSTKGVWESYSSSVLSIEPCRKA